MSLTKSVVKESSIVSEDIIKSEDETGNNPIYPTLNDISEEEKDSNSISFDFENSFK